MTMPWPLGMNTCGQPHESCLPLLIDVGFRYVYLDGTRLEADDLPASHAAVQKHADRLIPWSIHLPILFHGWELDEGQVTERLLRLIGNAAPYGVRNATLHVPCYSRISPEGFDEERVAAHRGKVMRVIRSGAGRGAEVGIRLNIENGMHAAAERRPGCCVASAADLKAYVEAVGAEGVGVCLDTGHAMLSGEDPAQMIRDLGGLLQETHFNDNFGAFPDRDGAECDYHRPPGIGKIDWLDVMDALEEIDFPHPVVFEEGMVQVGGDTFEYLARATYDNWRAFERARAKRDGRDPMTLQS